MRKRIFNGSSSDKHALHQVLEFTRTLSKPLDMPATVGHATQAARMVLAVDHCSVFLYDPVKNELYTTHVDSTQPTRLKLATGIAGACGRTKQIINVRDCDNDPRFNHEVDHKMGNGSQCLIAVPLLGVDQELVGVMQLLHAGKGYFGKRDEHIAQALASLVAAAIHRAKLLEEQQVKIRMERDLDLAKHMQMAALPKTLPDIPGYQMCTYFQPADRTGGDIYDLVRLPITDEPASPSNKQGTGRDPPESLVIFLADAMGHGIGPALSVTQARSMLRLGLRVGASLSQLIRLINLQVYQDFTSNRFITAFLGRLDLATHQVIYLSAGQGPIIHIHHKTGQYELRSASTLPLGIADDLPLETESEILEMASGDMLVLLTDGFFESLSPAVEQLGNDRISDYLCHARHKPVQTIVKGLVEMVHKFTHGAPALDDLTAIMIRRDVCKS